MTQDNSNDKAVVKKRYYESGALLAESQYVNGKAHGIQKVYYESGALLAESAYVNGKAHGVLKRYYESGALWIEIPYENGRRHGIKKFYNKDKASIEYLVLYKENWKVCSIEI